MKETITFLFENIIIKIFQDISLGENTIMDPLKQPRIETKERSGFTVIISAAPFALTQCGTMKSCSMTLTVALTGNHTATVEEQ